MEPANWEPDATARTFLPYRQGGGAAGGSLVDWRAYPYGRIWPVAERGTSPYPILRSLHCYDRLVPSVTPTWGEGCWGMENRYAFNGKEMDDQGEWGSTGANGQSNSMYDYGFRIYNPGIARFLSVDPLSPDYPWYTPYQFAGNSPVLNIDLDGLEPYNVNDGEGGTVNSSVEESSVPVVTATSLYEAATTVRDNTSVSGLNLDAGQRVQAARRQQPDQYWRSNWGNFYTTNEVYEWAARDGELASDLLQEKYGKDHAVGFMEFDTKLGIQTGMETFGALLLTITPLGEGLGPLAGRYLSLT